MSTESKTATGSTIHHHTYWLYVQVMHGKYLNPKATAVLPNCAWRASSSSERSSVTIRQPTTCFSNQDSGSNYLNILSISTGNARQVPEPENGRRP